MTGPLDTSRTARGGRGRTLVAFALVVAVVVALDQLVKLWARDALAAGEQIVLIPGVLGLRLVRNVGAAFGILGGHVEAFVICGVLVIAACLAYLFVSRSVRTPELLALSLVCAGAAGNIIDRVALGYVTDMFKTLFVEFPVFNVADVAIVCGCVLFVVCQLVGPRAAVNAGSPDGPGDGAHPKGESR